MEKQQIYHGLKCTAVLTAILLVFGLTPVEKDGVFSLGLSPQPAVYWMNMLIAFLSLYLVFVAVSSFKDTKEYTQKLTSGTLVIVMLYSSLHMALTKLPQWNSDRLYKLQNYDVADSLLSDVETDNCRIDTYNCFDNFGLFINRPCIQFFGSTVTPSIMEFYPQVGVARDVSSKPGRNMYALRTLLSTRYLIMPQWEVSEFEAEADLYGFDLVSDTYPYNVYENTNFIPMGFVYENYVSYEGLETVGKQNRANILLRAIATDESLIAKYNLPLQELPLNRLYDHSYSFYLTDVQERNKNASYYFRQTADGFDCNIALEKGNLVFFSVPYDKGFTAFVNGEKAEIEKVSYGMSAVYAPAGDNRITFVYKTPYLDAGVFLTLSGWVIYLSYVFINFKKSGTPMFLTKNIRS